VKAYQIGASPALVVAHAQVELAYRPISLAISGINYGENVGSDVTISGTVGAALQAASTGIPALAVSLQTPQHMHDSASGDVDFSVAARFACMFARLALEHALPPDVDVLKIDVPSDATIETPWRMTRVSRQTYWVNYARPRNGPVHGTSAGLGYAEHPRPEGTEPDSDIYALRIDRVVSVTPLSSDLTARVDLLRLGETLSHKLQDHCEANGLAPAAARQDQA
jgi:5'-nucleotidase